VRHCDRREGPLDLRATRKGRRLFTLHAFALTKGDEPKSSDAQNQFWDGTWLGHRHRTVSRAITAVSASFRAGTRQCGCAETQCQREESNERLHGAIVLRVGHYYKPMKSSQTPPAERVA